MKSFIVRRWYIIVPIFLIVGVVLYQQFSPKVSPTEETAYTVKRETIQQTLSISGEVQADEAVTLQFKSSGTLAWVGVKEGDHVKKNQLVAQLDAREIQKRYQKYLNTFMKTRWDFDQTKDDYNETDLLMLTDDQRRKALRIIDKSQFDLDNSVIDVELQNIAQEDAYLKTPLSGIVTSVDAPIAGTNITPTSGRITVVNPETMYLSATVDQTEVPELTDGMTGSIILDAYPDETLTAPIASISFSPVSGESGTVYEVKLALDDPNYDYKYRLGMSGDVEFVTKEIKNVLAVPIDYLKTEKEKTYVDKITDGKKSKVYVETGETNEESIEITKGLTEGDVIVQ